MAIALILQYHLNLAPCKLCYLQRGAVIGLGLIFLLACVHNPNTLGTRVYGVFCLFWVFLGLATTLRHIWIQRLPEDKVPACGPSIDYMLEVFSALQTKSNMDRSR
jgi:disulfide bond formation protein DsbB